MEYNTHNPIPRTARPQVVGLSSVGADNHTEDQVIANGKERRARIQVLRREIKRIAGFALTGEYMRLLKEEVWRLEEVERIARGTWGKA